MWWVLDDVQLMILASLLSDYPVEPEKHLTVRFRNSDQDIVLDIQLRNSDFGVSITSRQSAVGSESENIDDRFELIDYGNKQAFVDQTIRRFRELRSSIGRT